MSTANLPSDSNRYVEFDDYVEYQLAKTRKSIKTNDLLTACVSVAALLLTGVLAFVVLDHWVIPGGFSIAARWAWFTGLFGLVVGWLIYSVGIPTFRSVNRLFAAKELEHADPALRSNLLNWVDLHDAGRNVNPAVMKTIEKQAATQLSKMDVGQAVDHRRLLQTAYVLLTVVVLFCGYALFSPKKISTALWRMFPFTNAGAVTRTQILEVLPGDATLLARGRLEVSATLSGELPEAVQFLYSTSDGRIQDEAVQLRPEADGLARYRGVFAGETGQGVLQDFTYYLVAGDAKSERYRVVVQQPPSATVQEVGYRFPEYMKLEDAVTTGGHIDGWEGAIATITATADKPCKSATLQFLNDAQSQPTGEELPVQVTEGTNLRAEWTLAFRNDGTFPKHYRIQCRGENGEVDPAPVVYNIAVKPDRPPEVVLLHPERDLTAPANGVIPLLVQASDPDFELKYINLHAEQAGQPIHRQQLSEGRQQKVMLEHDFNLADLNLKAGDEFEFWVEAFDNRQPRLNRKNTPRIKVTIVEPATPEEAQKQLAEQKQERNERLQEANREQNSERSDQEPMPNEDEKSGDKDQDENEREPRERGDKPEENANKNESPKSSGAGEQPDGQQTGDPEQQSGGKSEDGKSDGKDGPAEKGTKNSPVSPDGDQDDEALETLNEFLNPNKEQPKDSGNERRQQKPGDRDQQPPRNSEKNPPSDDNNPAESNDDQNEAKDSSDEKSDAKREQKPKPANSQSKPSPKNGDESDSTEPMPAEDTESKDGSEAEPRTKPDGESKSQSKPNRNGKSPDAKTGDKPMPGDANSEEMPDDTGSKPESNNTEKPAGQNPKPAAKDDPGKKTEQQPKDRTNNDKNSTENDPESPDAEQPTAEGDEKPKNSNAKPDDKQNSQNNTEPKAQNKTEPKSKPASQGGKPEQNPGDSKDDKQTAEGDMPGDEDSESSSDSKDGKSKSDSRNSSSKSKSSTGKKSSDSKPSGDSNSESESDPQPGSESSDDTSEDGPQPQSSSEKNQKSKADQKSGANQKPKNGKSSDEKSKQPRPGDDADATPSKPGKEPSESEPQPSDNTDTEGDAKDKSQTGKPTENPVADAEKTGPGEKSKSKAKQKPDAKRDGAEEELKGKGDPNGQKSDKPDSGEEGASKEQPQGKPGKQPGAGEKTEEAGDDMVGKEKTGKPDPKERPGKGSTKKTEDKEGAEKYEGGEDGKPSQQGGNKKSQGGGESESSGKESGEGDSQGGKPGEGEGGKPSGKPGKTGKPGRDNPGGNGESSNPTQGDGTNGFAGKGGDAPDAQTDPDEANLDYNRRAAELVLQRLKDDLNNDTVDPKLLEELGWTPEQLARFTERLAKQLEKPADELSPLDEARRKQFEETLKSLNLKDGTAQRSGEKSPQRELEQTGARRAPVPQDYKAAAEAFTKSLSKQKAAKPKK